MRRANKEHGQALVEFALTLPVFLLILVAIFDLGHVVWANDALSNAAREAARYAVVHGGSPSTACPAGPPFDPGSVPAATATCPYPSPSRAAIEEIAARSLIGVGGDVSISVCYGRVSPCSGNVDETGATNGRGTPVTVSISATVSLAAPALLGLGPISLSTASTMIVSH